MPISLYTEIPIIQKLIKDNLIIDHVDAYHFVRAFRYGNVGKRDPLISLEKKTGSCSTKHMILHDILKLLDYNCTLKSMVCDFSSKFPNEVNLSLKPVAGKEPIWDLHHFVELEVYSDGEREKVILDATWPNEAKALGIPVNDIWRGEGSTVLAADPYFFVNHGFEFLELKSKFLEFLPPDDLARRSHFLNSLIRLLDR